MKTALLVIDMQSTFLSMTSVSLPNVLKLASYFQSSSLPIIFTQHGHSPSELKPPFRNQLVRKWGPDGSIHTNSPQWEFIPQIKDLITADTPVIPKNTYDAFLGTELEEVLKDKGVERVLVCGVMTDCCCDTTGRSAFNRGYETWLVHDACGSVNIKQHEAGLKAFGFAFGDVISTEEAVERLNAEA